MCEEDDDDCTCVSPVQMRPSLVLAGVFAFAAQVAEAVGDFLGTASRMCSAHYVYQAHRVQMHDEATREIETLTKEN
jgi:hypothetical protein